MYRVEFSLKEFKKELKARMEDVDNHGFKNTLVNMFLCVVMDLKLFYKYR